MNEKYTSVNDTISVDEFDIDKAIPRSEAIEIARSLVIEQSGSRVEELGMISVPEAFLPGGMRQPYVDPNLVRRVPIEGVPASAKTAVNSPYNPETLAIQAYGDFFAKP